MKFQLKKSLKGQKGFTLVELSVVVLVAGLMMGATMKGQSLMETARAQKLLNEVKNVEVLITQFSNQKGRLPGDCNRDGIVDYDITKLDSIVTPYLATATTQAARAGLYDYTGNDLSAVAATLSDTKGTGDLTACGDSEATATSDVAPDNNANRWINDLKKDNLISRNTTNRAFTKHAAEDFIYAGKYTGAATTGGVEDFNAITVAGVPVSMAKRLLLNVNGNEVNASAGQMRVINDTGVIISNTAFQAKKNNDIVSLIYFYRNQPLGS